MLPSARFKAFGVLSTMQMSVNTASAGQTVVRSRGVAPRPVNVEIPRINSAQQHRRSTQHSHTNNSISLLHGSSRSNNDTCRVAAAAAPAAAAAAAQATSDSSLRNFAVALAKAADDTKALDISVLHVEPVVSWTSYMVLCTGGAALMARATDPSWHPTTWHLSG